MNPVGEKSKPAPATKPAPSTSSKPTKKKFELNSKNLRLLMLSGLGLMVVVFFGITFYGLSVLGAKSKDMANLKTKSLDADNELSNLEQAKKQVQNYSYFKSVASTVIPNDKDQAQAIIEINQMATEAGINLQSITFPTSTLGAASTSTTPSSSSSATTEQSASSASSNTALTQAKAVTGIPGLYSLALTITPDTTPLVPPARKVTYAKMLDFLSKIENNRHTAQITQVIIQSGTNNDPTTLTFTLTVNIFIKPVAK